MQYSKSNNYDESFKLVLNRTDITTKMKLVLFELGVFFVWNVNVWLHFANCTRALNG